MNYKDMWEQLKIELALMDREYTFFFKDNGSIKLASELTPFQIMKDIEEAERTRAYAEDFREYVETIRNKNFWED